MMITTTTTLFLIQLLYAVQGSSLERLLTETSATACIAANSCSKCSALAQCKWCSAEVSISAQKQALQKSIFPLGTCVDATANCSAVTFGTLAGLSLNVRQVGGVNIRSVELKDDKWCSTQEIPHEVTAPTCEACHKLGKGYGWCQADYRVMGIINGSGGICIRKNLGYLCHSHITPKVPSPFDIIKPVLVYYENGDKCLSGNGINTSPQTVKGCSRNLSCQTCTDSPSGCTWCGGQAEVKGAAGEVIKFGAPGICMEGLENKCEHVQFGTLSKKLEEVKWADVKLQVGRMTRADRFCTRVSWPRLLAESTCPRCISAGGNWCDLDVTAKSTRNLKEDEYVVDEDHRGLLLLRRKPISAPPTKEENTELKEEISDLSFSGGLCLKPSSNFLCTLEGERITTSLKSDSCTM